MVGTIEKARTGPRPGKDRPQTHPSSAGSFSRQIAGHRSGRHHRGNRARAEAEISCTDRIFGPGSVDKRQEELIDRQPAALVAHLAGAGSEGQRTTVPFWFTTLSTGSVPTTPGSKPYGARRGQGFGNARQAQRGALRHVHDVRTRARHKRETNASGRMRRPSMTLIIDDARVGL